MARYVSALEDQQFRNLNAPLGRRPRSGERVGSELQLPHEPMRLALRHEAFTHPDWIFEIKYDGFRSLAPAPGLSE